MRVGRRGVAADDDGHAWRELSNPPRQRHDVVGFERVHGRDADEAQRGDAWSAGDARASG